jgi:hypothetical protein
LILQQIGHVDLRVWTGRIASLPSRRIGPG